MIKTFSCLFVSALASLTHAEARPMVIKPSHSLIQAMHRYRCPQPWLSAVMKASNISEDELESLSPNRTFTLDGSCAGTPSRDVVRATNRIITRERLIASAQVIVNDRHDEDANAQTIITNLKNQHTVDDIANRTLKGERDALALKLDQANRFLASRNWISFGSGVFLTLFIATAAYFLWLKPQYVFAKKIVSYEKGAETIHCNLGHLRYKVEDKWRKRNADDEIRRDRLDEHIANTYPEVGVIAHDNVTGHPFPATVV